MVSLLCLILVASAGLFSPSAQAQQYKNIFILAGQSNMSGRGGVVNNTWDGVVPPQCRPHPSVLRFSAELTWTEATEPLHRDIDVYGVCGVGPGIVFAKSLLHRAPSLGVVGLVPCAVGGTDISSWARGSYLYNQTIYRAWAAVQGGGIIRAVLWYQGESDTVNLDDANMYKDRLEKFFDDLRADLLSPRLPIIQVGLASGQGPFMEEVREGQLGVNLANLRWVDAKGLQVEPDYVHLSTPAQVRLGRMMADAFLGIRRNASPQKIIACLDP